MNKTIPWSVIGVDFDIREAAKEAARRNGLPLGDWLSSVIADQAAGMGVDPHRLTRDAQVETLAAQLAELTGGTPPSPQQSALRHTPIAQHDALLAAAIDRLEKSTRKTGKKAIRALNAVSGRLAAIEGKVGSASSTAPEAEGDIQAAFHDLQQELSRRLHSTSADPPLEEQFTAFAKPDPRDDLRDLKGEIGRLARNLDDLRAPPDLERLRREVVDLSRTVSSLAPRAALDSLERNMRAMSGEVQDLKRQPAAAAVLGQMQERIKDLQNIVLSSVTRGAAVEKIEQNVQTLGSQMSTLLEGKVERTDLDGLLQSIDNIQERLNSLAPKESVDALEQRVEKLARKIEQSLIRTQMDPPVASPSPPARIVEPAARAIAQAPMPQIPDDMLIEPGEGLPPHLQHKAPEIPAVTPDRAIQSTFIAAARRATLSAEGGEAGDAMQMSPDATQKVGTGELTNPRRRRPLLLGLGGALVGATALLTHQTYSGGRPGAMASTKDMHANSQPAAPSRPALQVGVYGKTDDTAPPPSESFDTATGKIATKPAGPNPNLDQLAQAGNAAAEYEKGLHAFEGKGTAQDFKASAAWFSKAAGQGLAPAQFFLASQYERGEGVDQDLPLAQAWYAKAAEQGHVRAMHNLGVMLAKGLGSKSDVAAAANWFRKAANYGLRDSQFNLGVLYGRGVGVPLDYRQSYVWFALAAAQGDARAAQMRDGLAAKLETDQLQAARTFVADFHALAADPAANQVPALAGARNAVENAPPRVVRPAAQPGDAALSQM